MTVKSCIGKYMFVVFKYLWHETKFFMSTNCYCNSAHVHLHDATNTSLLTKVKL